MFAATATVAAPSAFKWRPYQADALDAAERVLREPGANPIVVLPTGSGKGPISAEIARRFIAATGQRVIVATHIKELVAQNFKQARRVAPRLSAGIFSASLGRKDRHGDITVANVQSIAGHARFFPKVGLLIIDEAHLLAHGDEGQYHDLIKGLRANRPDLHVVGLTATPWRTNSGNLTEPYKGMQPLFNEVAYEIGIGELMAEGWLTRLVGMPTRTQQSVAGVHVRGGEYKPNELDAAVNTDPLNEAITEEALQSIGNRSRILDFCVSVDHARRVAETWKRRGISAAFVASDTKLMLPQERDRVISAFKAGRIRVLANCGILTTGFDDPYVDCIVHRRPTASPGLFLQICGRGTRVAYADGYDLETRDGRLAAIANGQKPNCLMLDFAGNVRRHGHVDKVRGVHKSGKANPDDDLVECPSCRAYNAKEDTNCINCGIELPKSGGGGATSADKEAKLLSRNVAGDVMTGGLQEFPVLGMRFSAHNKPGSPPTLKLSFRVPNEPWPVTQWLCLEHEGWVQKKARQQWRQFAGTSPPRSVEEALQRADELKYPTRIWARREGNFWVIEGLKF